MGFEVASSIKFVSWDDGGEMGKPHWPGLPLPGSPLVYLLPQLCRARINCPHPFGRGGVGAAGVRSGLAGALVLGTTSLKTGEGPLTRWMCVAGRELR